MTKDEMVALFWNTVLAGQDPRVVAIRGNPKVGKGTGSIIDECWEATALVVALEMVEITDPETAVEWAIEMEEALCT